MERFRIYSNNQPATGFITANNVVQIVEGDSCGGIFPPLWSIEWFTYETSRGMVSFDQVKRFANGGPLSLPEELAGKDKLSLQEWEQRFSVSSGLHESGCRFVADVYNESRPYLFLLTDYIVSSVCAGTIWLVPRQCSVGTETGK